MTVFKPENNGILLTVDTFYVTWYAAKCFAILPASLEEEILPKESTLRGKNIFVLQKEFFILGADQIEEQILYFKIRHLLKMRQNEKSKITFTQSSSVHVTIISLLYISGLFHCNMVDAPIRH